MGPFNFQDDNVQAAEGASSGMKDIELFFAELVQTKEDNDRYSLYRQYFQRCDYIKTTSHLSGVKRIRRCV